MTTVVIVIAVVGPVLVFAGWYFSRVRMKKLTSQFQAVEDKEQK